MTKPPQAPAFRKTASEKLIPVFSMLRAALHPPKDFTAIPVAMTQITKNIQLATNAASAPPECPRSVPTYFQEDRLLQSSGSASPPESPIEDNSPFMLSSSGAHPIWPRRKVVTPGLVAQPSLFTDVRGRSQM